MIEGEAAQVRTNLPPPLCCGSERCFADVHAPQSYPPEEMEWLATTAFNRAVDFYCASQDAECRRWAEKALRLGRAVPDGGRLGELLQEKFLGLAWES